MLPMNRETMPVTCSFVDQRRFELLTSPVRGVPKSFTACVHIFGHLCRSEGVSGSHLFPSTPISESAVRDLLGAEQPPTPGGAES